MIVDIVVEVAVGRTGMGGTVVESAAVVVEQTAVGLESWHDRIAKVAEPEVAEKGLPDARVVSVHTQLGITSSETVVAEAAGVDLMVSVAGPEGL